MRRPLPAAAIFLAIGIISSYSIFERKSALGAGLLILAAISAAELCGIGRRYLVICALGFAVFALSFHSYSSVTRFVTARSAASGGDGTARGVTCEIRGRVAEVHSDGGKLSIRVRTDGALRCATGGSSVGETDGAGGGSAGGMPSGALPDGTDVLVTYYGDAKPEDLAGRTVIAEGDLSIPAGRKNPRCFDYRLYLRSRGVSLVMYADRVSAEGALRGLTGLITALSSAAREGYAHAVVERSGDESAALARAVLFGEDEYLPEETLEAYRSNGTAHVLAVSGLHVGLIYGAWKKIKDALRMRRGDAAFAAFLLFYCACASWSPSVVRASAAVMLNAAADRLCRRFDMTSALSAVLIVSCAVRPYSLFSPGLQMSYIAVLSMTFLTPHFLRSFGRYASAALPVQISAAAYSAAVYGTIPVMGLIANVPVLFLMSAYVPVGAAGFAIYLITRRVPAAAAVFLRLTGNVCTAVNKAAYAGGATEVLAPRMTFPLLIFLGVSAALISCEWTWIHLIARTETRKAAGALLALALVALFAFEIDRTPFDRAAAVFVDVGQGDCLHLKADGGTDVLIDGGGSVRRNVGKNTLRSYLLANGREDVDLALATHLHTDHFKGLRELSECYPVDAVRTSWTKGSVIRIGGDARIDVLWPLEQNTDSGGENYYSVVYKVEVHGISILVTGDITEEGETALVKEYEGTDELKCDILKIAHHGSRYSSCAEFLDAADPEAAVICVGRNTYGHPSPSVIERLSEKGIMIFRTDLDGAVGIIPEEDGFSICAEAAGTITRFS